MQCPDCKSLRHNGPCDPVYEDEPGMEQFYQDMELDKAKEVIRQSAARGLSKDLRDRNEFMMAMNDTNPGADCEPR